MFNETPLLSRVGVVGDVHGQARTLDTVLTFLQAVSPPPDAVLCTGDLPDKGYTSSGETARGTNDCAVLLGEFGALTVRGNHDRYCLDNADDPMLAELFKGEWEQSPNALAFVKSLPKTRRLETIRGTLLLCHGVVADDRAGIYPNSDDMPVAEALAGLEQPLRFVIAGHTHRRMVRTVAGVTVINPGALIADREPAGFAVADFHAENVTFYDIRPGQSVLGNGDTFC